MWKNFSSVLIHWGKNLKPIVVQYIWMNNFCYSNWSCLVFFLYWLGIQNICYYRKICQHCRCPREDHNIIEDDAREGCSVYLGDANYSGFPSDDDSGCALEEYAWIPPGLNAEQVSTDAQWIFCFVSSTQFLSKCNGSKLVSTLSFLVVGVKAGVLHSSKRIKSFVKSIT